MEYQQTVGFEILVKMEQYEGDIVPDPFLPIDPDTRLPVTPSTTIPEINLDDLATRRTNRPILARPAAPTHTHPESWLGEMPVALYRQHATWLKEEGFITVNRSGHPESLKMKGVRLLKEVAYAGGWEEARATAKEEGAPDTLTDTLKSLESKRRNKRGTSDNPPIIAANT